ncbi:hypothetical protein C8R43DRAFT_1170465 [Mycena crocata]|nr:hypothetical protein C8R43DRAFT_1170465 [Mycena crocata]
MGCSRGGAPIGASIARHIASHPRQCVSVRAAPRHFYPARIKSESQVLPNTALLDTGNAGILNLAKGNGGLFVPVATQSVILLNISTSWSVRATGLKRSGNPLQPLRQKGVQARFLRSPLRRHDLRNSRASAQHHRTVQQAIHLLRSSRLVLFAAGHSKHPPAQEKHHHTAYQTNNRPPLHQDQGKSRPHQLVVRRTMPATGPRDAALFPIGLDGVEGGTESVHVPEVAGVQTLECALEVYQRVAGGINSALVIEWGEQIPLEDLSQDGFWISDRNSPGIRQRTVVRGARCKHKQELLLCARHHITILPHELIPGMVIVRRFWANQLAGVSERIREAALRINSGSDIVVPHGASHHLDVNLTTVAPSGRVRFLKHCQIERVACAVRGISQDGPSMLGGDEYYELVVSDWFAVNAASEGPGLKKDGGLGEDQSDISKTGFWL